MRTKIYKFWDFDGTLSDSPLPEAGKEQYKIVKGVDYPFLGWWGRPESLDLNIHNIELNPVLKPELIKSLQDSNIYNFILTARIMKLQNYIKAVLIKNGINIELFKGFSYVSDRDKGQRILDMIAGHEDIISEIHVYDDREKEFVVLEKVRHIIEGYGIKYNVIKVDIDADFNRK